MTGVVHSERSTTLLSDLNVGGKGRVTAIDGTDAISVRLMEMGILPGTELRLVGMAPLGDPLEVEVRGYRLSMRKCEAARVSISKPTS